MKKLLTLVLLINTTLLLSQVGIGTTNPQEQLHISGTQPANIRIDGLNNTNPNNNSGDNSVYADANGTLQLKNDTPISQVNLIGSAFVNAETLQTNDGSVQCTTIANGTFNLTQNKNVGLFVNCTVGNILTTTGIAITDGAPRLMLFILTIDGVEVMRDVITYNNAATTGGIPVGRLKLSGARYKQLTSGNHIYNIDVCVFGSSRGFRATFGPNATTNESNSFQIIQ